MTLCFHPFLKNIITFMTSVYVQNRQLCTRFSNNTVQGWTFTAVRPFFLALIVLWRHEILLLIAIVQFVNLRSDLVKNERLEIKELQYLWENPTLNNCVFLYLISLSKNTWYINNTGHGTKFCSGILILAFNWNRCLSLPCIHMSTSKNFWIITQISWSQHQIV